MIHYVFQIGKINFFKKSLVIKYYKILKNIKN